MAPMRWSDMDALGHVHNARFMEYYEAARTDLVQRLLTTLGEAGGVGLVVRRHEVDYLLPLVYRPQPVVVDSWVTRIGRTSFALHHVAGEADGQTIYGQATTTIVAVDAGTGRPIEMPPQLREALAEFTEATQ
jgi:acyl-CoA thioester hydrolase